MNPNHDAGAPVRGKAGYSILLIEDDQLVREALQDSLRSMGHQVSPCTKGSDAIRLMQFLEPNIVVTDIIMPDIDMLDALKELRKLRPATKIIAISGNPHLLTLAAGCGADNILAKPFACSKLDTLIRRTMQ